MPSRLGVRHSRGVLASAVIETRAARARGVRTDSWGMSLDHRCPQCAFVSRQLGQPTPCLLHVSLAPEAAGTDPVEAPTPPAEYDEPYVFGQLHPTVDRPGPFSLREYVRLQLLRSRLEANPSPLDEPAPRTQGKTLSRR
jgi:hypothetical protein